MKFSVLGGSGFIGQIFCNLLDQKGIEFEILDIQISQKFPKKFKYTDIRYIDNLRDNLTGDIVVNLAAVHRDDVIETSDYYNTNVMGCENLSKVCAEKKISHIIFTSSVAVYGFALPGTDENGEINPFNDYGKSKFQAEEVLKEWADINSKNKLTIIRPTVVFGEGNRGNVYNLFKILANRHFVMIGRGQNVKSIAYVENVASFVFHCSTLDGNRHVINYVDYPNFNMNELVKNIQNYLFGTANLSFRLPFIMGLGLGYVCDLTSKVVGKRLPISSIRVKKFCASSEFSSLYLEKTGFQAPVHLEKAIAKTLDYEFR